MTSSKRIFGMAYSHPALHLLSNWMPGHRENMLAFAPVNRNGVNLFAPGKASNINIKEVVETIGEMM